MKDMFIAAIERTQNPLAPIILQEAYSGAERVGKMFASIGDQAAVEDYTKNLLQNFPHEMDHIAKDPNFICALCGLLSGALIAYGSSLKTAEGR